MQDYAPYASDLSQREDINTDSERIDMDCTGIMIMVNTHNHVPI
jgi:hypothetical protein